MKHTIWLALGLACAGCGEKPVTCDYLGMRYVEGSIRRDEKGVLWMCQQQVTWTLEGAAKEQR